MRKTLCAIMALIMAMLIFPACGGNESKQQLTINDLEIYLKDEPVEITAIFKDETKREYITYEYDETLVEISGNKISALKEGETTIKAKAYSCSTTFKVTCLPPCIQIDDMYAWFNTSATSSIVYPESEITVKLADIIKDEPVTYTYDSDAISIVDGKVKALKQDTVQVTASAGGKSNTFLVHAHGYDPTKKNKSEYDNKEAARRNLWEAKGTTNSTIFIGDSFFDPDFWTNFNSFYSGYDALLMGIGGTRSFHWDLFSQTILKDAQPKNAVINLGNNDVYNDGLLDDYDATIESLQRFHTLLHGLMPNTKLYTFSITARNTTAAWDPEYVVKKINKEMKKWCEGKDWITYIDLQDVMTYDKLKDTIHPMPQHYSYFVDALYDAGIEIEAA